MNILFECDNNAYVVELCSQRLYAKVSMEKNVPIRYSATASPLLNPASFHEYREEDEMLIKKLTKLVSNDLKEAIG